MAPTSESAPARDDPDAVSEPAPEPEPEPEPAPEPDVELTALPAPDIDANGEELEAHLAGLITAVQAVHARAGTQAPHIHGRAVAYIKGDERKKRKKDDGQDAMNWSTFNEFIQEPHTAYLPVKIGFFVTSSASATDYRTPKPCHRWAAVIFRNASGRRSLLIYDCDINPDVTDTDRIRFTLRSHICALWTSASLGKRIDKVWIWKSEGLGARGAQACLRNTWSFVCNFAQRPAVDPDLGVQDWKTRCVCLTKG